MAGGRSDALLWTRPVVLVALCSLAFLALLSAGTHVSAESADDVYPTAEEAAHAAFTKFLDSWTVLGSCESEPPPAEGDALCYFRNNAWSGESFEIYSARPYFMTDTAWWLGLEPVEGGWMMYDGGPCHLFGYCRVSDPSGGVLDGHPNGDVNCDDVTDSVDALLVLQYTSELVSEVRCLVYHGNVDGVDYVDAMDALLILQDTAGLLSGLPTKRFSFVP